MPGKTITEKILSMKSGRDARAGDVVVCDVDYALGTDGSTPMALDYFAAMGGTKVRHPERIAFALDHYAPAPTRATSQLHQRMRAFAAEQGIHLWDVGEGIGHQLIVESGRARPGGLVVGADSHAVTYGAMNCFGTGIGSSDLAAILLCGRIWLRVSETIRVTLRGALRPGVYAKDVALAIAKELGAAGATYQALEFAGESLEIDDRLVLANLSVEIGAKNAIFPADEKTAEYLAGKSAGRDACPTLAQAPSVEQASLPAEADHDAIYAREITIDLDRLEPMVALPHLVDKVVPLNQASGTRADMVYLGTCTGGRVSDFHEALRVIRAGGGIAPGVQLVVTPASREVLTEITRDGTLAAFIEYGAIVQTPGCGSCCGTCGQIPGDGANVISTANRNFKGRMGNSESFIYLASPATCAQAAVRGKLP